MESPARSAIISFPSKLSLILGGTISMSVWTSSPSLSSCSPALNSDSTANIAERSSRTVKPSSGGTTVRVESNSNDSAATRATRLGSSKTWSTSVPPANAPPRNSRLAPPQLNPREPARPASPPHSAGPSFPAGRKRAREQNLSAPHACTHTFQRTKAWVFRGLIYSHRQVLLSIAVKSQPAYFEVRFLRLNHEQSATFAKAMSR